MKMAKSKTTEDTIMMSIIVELESSATTGARTQKLPVVFVTAA